MTTVTEEVKVQVAEEAKPEGEAKPTQEEKRTYTEEEVEAIRKKHQSDSEKGVQKLLAETKFKDSVLEATKQISKANEDGDNAALVKLHEKNPRVAQEILKLYYDGKSIDQYKEEIGYKEDLSDPEVYARRLDADRQKAIEQIKIDAAKEVFVKELKMTDDEQKEFDKAFDERRGMKTFSLETVTTHLERAFREIDKTDIKKLRSQETIAKTVTTGEPKGGGNAKSRTPLQEELAKFVRDHVV
jgi:hypothetical protein